MYSISSVQFCKGPCTYIEGDGHFFYGEDIFNTSSNQKYETEVNNAKFCSAATALRSHMMCNVNENYPASLPRVCQEVKTTRVSVCCQSFAEIRF